MVASISASLMQFPWCVFLAIPTSLFSFSRLSVSRGFASRWTRIDSNDRCGAWHASEAPQHFLQDFVENLRLLPMRDMADACELDAICRHAESGEPGTRLTRHRRGRRPVILADDVINRLAHEMDGLVQVEGRVGDEIRMRDVRRTARRVEGHLPSPRDRGGSAQHRMEDGLEPVGGIDRGISQHLRLVAHAARTPEG